MKLYLARHGEALPQDIDPESPLSDKGKKDIQALAKFIAPLKLSVSFFFHSGKLRAEQTATILSQALSCERGVEMRGGLEPLDLVGPIASEINQFEENLALVGHMPFMGKLVAKLITGYETSDIIAFQPGTLACLERVVGNVWVLKWVLGSELFNN